MFAHGPHNRCITVQVWKVVDCRLVHTVDSSNQVHELHRANRDLFGEKTNLG